MPCEACPFAFTDKSEEVQGLGCLPSVWEIMTLKRETDRNWACHENEKRQCAGQITFCHEENIDTKSTKPLLTYSKWYHEGFSSELE